MDRVGQSGLSTARLYRRGTVNRMKVRYSMHGNRDPRFIVRPEAAPERVMDGFAEVIEDFGYRDHLTIDEHSTPYPLRYFAVDNLDELPLHRQ
jgi:hypothetical protein